MRKFNAVFFLTLAGMAVAQALVVSPGPTAVPAPEMDPASALSALTFLIGGLAAFRGKRSK